MLVHRLLNLVEKNFFFGYIHSVTREVSMERDQYFHVFP